MIGDLKAQHCHSDPATILLCVVVTLDAEASSSIGRARDMICQLFYRILPLLWSFVSSFEKKIYGLGFRVGFRCLGFRVSEKGSFKYKFSPK